MTKKKDSGRCPVWDQRKHLANVWLLEEATVFPRHGIVGGTLTKSLLRANYMKPDPCRYHQNAPPYHHCSAQRRATCCYCIIIV